MEIYKKLSVCTKNYPEIGESPVPIQKLLAQELDAVEGRLERGKPVPEFDRSLICYYRYFLDNCKLTRQETSLYVTVSFLAVIYYI